MIAIVINILIIILEFRALYLCWPRKRWALFYFYTQLSNMVTAVSSVLLLAAGSQGFVVMLRYLSTCMMIMTFLVSTCVLVPMGGDPKLILWSKTGLLLHLICPVLSTVSYIFAERHVGWEAFALPVTVTLVYGLVMLLLNALRIVDGPYPFFRVYKQSVRATILWMIVLTGVIGGISAAVILIASQF